MDFDPKQIISKFEDIAKSSSEEVHSTWWAQYEYNTNRIKSILNSLKIDLAQSDRWKENPERFWSDMRILISRIQQWVRSLQVVESEFPINELADDFHKNFDQLITDLPSEIRILIGDFYWQSTSADNFFTRLRKKMRPLRYNLQAMNLKTKNIIRGILQKPSVKKESDKRIIKLHDFLSMYVAFPFNEYIKNEWTSYLQTILGQYFIILGKSTDLLENMFLHKRTEKLINSDNENIFDSLYAMAETLKEIDITFESINEYKALLHTRFDKFWQEMESNFIYAWDRAGTFQLPNKKFSNDEFQAQNFRLENRHKRDLQLWQNQMNGLRGEWQKNLSLTQLGLNASVSVFQGTRHFTQNTAEKIKPELESTRRQVSQMILKIDKTDNIKAFKNYYDQKLREFSRARFSQLLDTVSSAQLPGLINQALDTIKSFQNEMIKSVDIFIHRDTLNLPPRSKVRSIGLRRLVEFSTYKPCEEKCIQLHDHILEKQDEIYRNISQLGRMIEFQFESAHQLISEHDLDERLDEAKLIIRDTLAKAELQISNIIDDISGILDSVKKYLPENLHVFATHLIELFSSETVIMENIKQAKEQNRHSRSILLSSILNLTKKMIHNLIYRPWQHITYILKTYFIHTDIETKSKEIVPIQDSVSRFLRETSDKISHLPYIYRKLFLFSPLTSPRFYSARQSEFEALREEFSHWYDGEPGMVALIGELGSGRTTLLNMAKDEIFEQVSTIHMDSDSTVASEQELAAFLAHHLEAKKVTSLRDLVLIIEKKAKRRVCILEDLNLLFAKSVKGMELLEQLMGFMIQTQTQIFWVVTCSYFSWQYLRKTIKAEKYFQRLIYLGEFSNGDIKSIIMNRHRLSGYDLLFESNGHLAQSKKLSKNQSEDHRQELLDKQYFGKLNEISAGNVSVAMLYWLRSINSIQDDKVVLNPSIDFDYDFLNNLSQTELFTLAAIVNFDCISISDHAHLFNQSVDHSDLHLNQMRRYGILIEENDKYLIHPFLYRHLVELLKSKNILH